MDDIEITRDEATQAMLHVAKELGLDEQAPVTVGAPRHARTRRGFRSVSIVLTQYTDGTCRSELVVWQDEPWRLRAIRLVDVARCECGKVHEYEELERALVRLNDDEEALSALI